VETIPAGVTTLGSEARASLIAWGNREPRRREGAKFFGSYMTFHLNLQSMGFAPLRLRGSKTLIKQWMDDDFSPK
jgi:hypothetical protein